MILLIAFILLVFSFYMFKHFENRRDVRNAEYHEKRREAFTDLLNKLKENETTDTIQNKNENI